LRRGGIGGIEGFGLELHPAQDLRAPGTQVLTYPVQISQYFGSQSTFWAKISAMSVLGTLRSSSRWRRSSAIWFAASRSVR
jgi:hypothetical protein